MKYIEIINLRNSLQKVKGLNGFETKITIRKNITRLETEIKPLAKEEEEILELISEFRNEKNQLSEKYKNDNSEKSEHENLFESLKEKHKEQIEEYEDKFKKFQDYLKEKDSGFNPITIPLSQIKEFDSEISEENLDLIFTIIDQEK